MQYDNINHKKKNKKKNNNNGNRNFSKVFCLEINTYFGKKNLCSIFCHSEDKIMAIQSRGSHSTSKSFLSFIKRYWTSIKGILHNLSAFEGSDEVDPLAFNVNKRVRVVARGVYWIPHDRPSVRVYERGSHQTNFGDMSYWVLL